MNQTSIVELAVCEAVGEVGDKLLLRSSTSLSADLTMNVYGSTGDRPDRVRSHEQHTASDGARVGVYLGPVRDEQRDLPLRRRPVEPTLDPLWVCLRLADRAGRHW